MIRRARVADIPAIQTLINSNLDKLLPRDEKEIRKLIRFFWVAEESGEVVACCCLEIYSPKIGEIRSLVVRKDLRERGYGEKLVKTAIAAAKRKKVKQVLVVTSSRDYFEKLGFGSCLNEKFALFWNGTTPK